MMKRKTGESLHLTKSKKMFIDKSTSMDDNTENQQSSSSDDISMNVRSLKESFLKKDISYFSKITFLSAIDLIMSRETKICSDITKKEVIDEIANLVQEIVSKDSEGHREDLVVIARIVTKLNLTSEGKKLIGDMNLSFSAFEKLKAEMKKFELNLDPNQFAFDFESNKIKNET